MKKTPFTFILLAVAALILAGVAVLIGLRRGTVDSPNGEADVAATKSPVRTMAGQTVVESEFQAAPDEALPPFLEETFLTASLEALAKNGADLSLPMPSKHLVRCESREIAGRMTAWGRENGFEIGEPVISLGHGGVEFFDVELRRTEVPDAGRIQKEGEKVLAAVGGVDGAEYATWVGEIVRR